MTNKPMLSVGLKLNDRQECDLIRFHETCEDSQPYDVSKEGMKSLARIGLVRSLGFSRYELTDVGSAAVYKLLEFLRSKPAAQHQGEPVACLVRSRNILTQASIAVDGKDHFSAWSAWEPNSIEHGRAVTDPLRNDPVCYEIELLFKDQSAPVAADLAHDRAYRDGLKRGFGLGENGQVEQYHKEFSAYQNGIVGASKDERDTVAVVVPERKTKADYSGYIEQFQSEAAGLYNSALDDVARLNGVKP